MGYEAQERKNILTEYINNSDIYQSQTARDISISQTRACLYNMFDIKKEKIEQIAINQEDEIWKCFIDTSELFEAEEDFKKNSSYAREVCMMILKLGEYVFLRKIPKAYKRKKREPNIALKETKKIIDQHKKIVISNPKDTQKEKQQKFINILHQLTANEKNSSAIVADTIQIMEKEGEKKAREFFNNFFENKEKEKEERKKKFTDLFPHTIKLFYHGEKEKFSLGNFLEIAQKLEPCGLEVLESIQEELEKALLEIYDNSIKERQVIEKIIKNLKDEIIRKKKEDQWKNTAKKEKKNTKNNRIQNEDSDVRENDAGETSENNDEENRQTKKEKEIREAADKKTQEVMLVMHELLSIVQEQYQEIKKQLEEIKKSSNKQKKIIAIVNDFIKKFHEEKEKRTTPTTKNTLECLTKIRQNDILSIPQMDKKKLQICIHNKRFTNSIEDIIKILEIKIQKKEEIMQFFLMIERENHKIAKKRTETNNDENDIIEEIYDTEAYLSQEPSTAKPETIDDSVEEDSEDMEKEEYDL